MLALSRACLISNSAVVEEVTRKALYKAPVGISYTVMSQERPCTKHLLGYHTQSLYDYCFR